MTKLIVGSTAKVFENALLRYGFSPIFIPDFNGLSGAVTSHPDSLIYVLPSGELLTYGDYYRENEGFFSSLPFSFVLTDEEYGRLYPYDILLNALPIDNYIVGRCDRISRYIMNGKAPLTVRQGYARCSSLAIGSSVITADKGISSAMLSKGYDTLLIQPGHILLSGCDYGFIGGASFVHGKTVYFFGDISLHPDYPAINNFLSERGYLQISLSNQPLCDCGSAICM